MGDPSLFSSHEDHHISKAATCIRSLHFSPDFFAGDLVRNFFRGTLVASASHIPLVNVDRQTGLNPHKVACIALFVKISSLVRAIRLRRDELNLDVEQDHPASLQTKLLKHRRNLDTVSRVIRGMFSAQRSAHSCSTPA